MTFYVEPALHAGGHAFYAITTHSCHLGTLGKRLLGHGKKSPVLILVVKDGTVTGIDMDGHRKSPDDIDREFPGILEKIQT